MSQIIGHSRRPLKIRDCSFSEQIVHIGIINCLKSLNLFFGECRFFLHSWNLFKQVLFIFNSLVCTIFTFYKNISRANQIAIKKVQKSYNLILICFLLDTLNVESQLFMVLGWDSPKIFHFNRVFDEKRVSQKLI